MSSDLTMPLAASAAPVFDAQAFDEALLVAVEASQTGFHFEEGGCWGMAAALHDVMVRAGVPAQIRFVPDGFVHAWVRAADADWDYRGTMFSTPTGHIDVESVDALRAVAENYGVDEETFEADRAMANDIVATAMAMAVVRCNMVVTPGPGISPA